MLKRELLKLWVAAAVAIATPILIVLAAYDVSGTSPPDPFSTGAWSTHTPTATHTAVTSTPTSTPSHTPTFTATATTTPRPCGPVHDASLAFDPSSIEARGSGPFEIDVRLKNNGAQSVTRDVVLTLSTLKNPRYLDEVALPGGATWVVGGITSSTTYAAGDIAPNAEVSVPLTVRMTAAWSGAGPASEAKIRVDVQSARCLRHESKARLTVTMTRGTRAPSPTGVGERSAPTSTPTSASQLDATAVAADTPDPSPNPTQTATPTPTATPATEDGSPPVTPAPDP